MTGLTVDDPIVFEKAIHSARVLPGDTIWLKPGTYTPYYGGAKGTFEFNINGTVANPIIIRPVTPGTVWLNGGVSILQGNSGHIIIKDLEIGPTPTTRNILRENVDYPSAVYITAPGCSLFGNHIHDGSQGLSLFNCAPANIAENIFSSNGWLGHGTNIYTHNQNGGPISLTHNCFMIPFGADNLNHWSATSNNVQDYDTKENAFGGSAVLFATESGLLQNNTFHHNHVFRGYLRLGVSENPGSLTTDVHDNRFYSENSAWMFLAQRQANVQNNFFTKNSAADSYGIYSRNSTEEANIIDNNNYYLESGGGGVYSLDNPGTLTNAQWQALGFDVNSSFVAGHPATNEAFCYPFIHSDRWVGQIVIWNWEGLDSVLVDITNLNLANGNYVLVSAQDCRVDRVAVVVDDSKSITVDMRTLSHTVETPAAYSAPETTFPLFGAFVVQRA